VDRAKAEAEASHIRTEAVARELHLETIRTASKLREEQRIEAEALACKLEHVHDSAKEAFKEANDVNIKIANYNKRLLERGAEAVERLDTIEHIATENTAQLEVIAENTRKDEA
jgi:sugar phosphate isomerase/epimerase